MLYFMMLTMICMGSPMGVPECQAAKNCFKIEDGKFEAVEAHHCTWEEYGELGNGD